MIIILGGSSIRRKNPRERIVEKVYYSALLDPQCTTWKTKCKPFSLLLYGYTINFFLLVPQITDSV